MALGITEVEEALLALGPDERTAVIERGLLSLDEVDEASPDDVRAAWSAEIDRRVDEHLHGRGRLTDVDQHFAAVRQRLATRQS